MYYAHRDDLETPLEEIMEAFDRLVKAGQVRVVGASNLSLRRIAEANTISRAHQWGGCSVVEQRYTYLRPRHGADFGPRIFVTGGLNEYDSAPIRCAVWIQRAIPSSNKPGFSRIKWRCRITFPGMVRGTADPSASPDFLLKLVALANFMRLSLLKGAHVALSCAAWQEIRVRS